MLIAVKYEFHSQIITSRSVFNLQFINHKYREIGTILLKNNVTHKTIVQSLKSVGQKKGNQRIILP